MLVCLSVCLSVRHVRVFCPNVLTNKRIFIFFHYRVATPFSFFHSKHYGNIPTKTPNRGIECKWSRQKSQFSIVMIACCERFYQQLQYTQLHWTVASWWRWYAASFVFHGRRRRQRKRDLAISITVTWRSADSVSFHEDICCTVYCSQNENILHIQPLLAKLRIIYFALYKWTFKSGLCCHAVSVCLSVRHVRGSRQNK